MAYAGSQALQTFHPTIPYTDPDAFNQKPTIKLIYQLTPGSNSSKIFQCNTSITNIISIILLSLEIVWQKNQYNNRKQVPDNSKRCS